MNINGIELSQQDIDSFNKSHKTCKMGVVYTNNKGSEYIILGRAIGKDCNRSYAKVRFLETGYELVSETVQVKRGTIKDRYAKNVLGIASIGDVNVKDNQRAYNIWHKMLGRCYVVYDRSYGSYGAKGVTVCDRWLCLENFVKDIPLIDRYNEEKFMNNEIHLDKDLKQIGKSYQERVYSLATCTFLSPQENSSLVDSTGKETNFIAINPNGDKTIEKGIKKFCRNNQLDYGGVSRALKEFGRVYKGWSFVYD